MFLLCHFGIGCLQRGFMRNCSMMTRTPLRTTPLRTTTLATTIRHTITTAIMVNKDSRVPTFNEHYAFSRVMLTFIIISIAILISRYDSCWQFYVISIPMLVIAWYRCKMRGYYYAREVLKEYINIKENK